MSKGLIIGLVIGVLVLFGGCSVVGMGIGVKNKSAKLTNLKNAQESSCKLVYDKVWKILQQEAGVLDKYSDDFKAIYVELMNGRYDGEKTHGSPMFKMITESNPQFSSAMYENLMRDIKSLRTEYELEQKKLVSIKNTHDDLRTIFPGSIFCSILGIDEMKIALVTSTKTENVYRTGKEDDVDLFQKKK